MSAIREALKWQQHDARSVQAALAELGRYEALPPTIVALIECWDMSADALGPQWVGLAKQKTHAWEQPLYGLIVQGNGMRDDFGTRLSADFARTS